MLKLILATVVTLGMLVSASEHEPLPGWGNLESLANEHDKIIEYLKRHQGTHSPQDTLEEWNKLIEQAQDFSASMLSKDQMESVLHHYYEEHMKENFPAPYGSQSDEKAMKEMLHQYVKTQHTLAYMSTAPLRNNFQAMAKQLMEHGDLDSIKEFLLTSTKAMAEEANQDPRRQLLFQLLAQVMMHPQDELLRTMLQHNIEQADPENKGYLAVLLLHTIKNPEIPDELREGLKGMLQYTLSEGGVATEQPRTVQFLLLQHYVGMQQDNDLDNVLLILMSTLQDLEDEESKRLAAKLVYKMVTMKREPKDIEEDERFLWYPPTVCHIEDSSGGVQQMGCPHNMQCSVAGPDGNAVQVTVNNTEYRVKFCSMPTQHLLFHSCDVTFLNGTNTWTNQCPMGTCSVGPFRVQWSEGEFSIDLNAMYCSSMADNYGKEMTVVDRACAVVTEEMYVLGQRHCPEGYSCRMGPFEIPDGALPPYPNMNNKAHAYVCGKKEQKSFMTDALAAVIGAEGDALRDGLESMINPMSAPNMTAAADANFLKFVVEQVEASRALMDYRDPDNVGMLILKFFIEAAKEEMGSAGLPGEVFEILWYKKGKYGLDEHDRQVMHSLIIYFVAHIQAMEEAANQASARDILEKHIDDHRSGDDANMDQLRELMNHLQTHGDRDNPDMMEMLRMLMDHHDDHQNPDQDPAAMLRLLRMLIQHHEDQQDRDQDPAEMLRALMERLAAHEDQHKDMSRLDILGAFGEMMFNNRMKDDFLSAAYKHLMENYEKLSEEKAFKLGLMIAYARIEEELMGEFADDRKWYLMKAYIHEMYGIDMEAALSGMGNNWTAKSMLFHYILMNGKLPQGGAESTTYNPLYQWLKREMGAKRK